MKISRILRTAAALALSATSAASAQTISLTVAAGRPMDIRLDDRVVIKKVGQSVTGVLVEPLYAYDRIVVPAGTHACGRIMALEGPSTFARVRAALSGDLTPARRVVLQFETLVLPSGDVLPIESTVTAEIPHQTRASAPRPKTDDAEATAAGRLRRKATDQAAGALADAKQRGRDALDAFRQPGKGARLKEAIVERLPVHPQFIGGGTGYHVQLTAPLTFGTVAASVRASDESRPAPSSLLKARLLTSLDSAKTPRGTRIQAVVTEPVFTSDHALIIAEGTVLDGEVTFAKAARWLHRNGQLRFLFDTIHRDAGAPAPLLASLERIEASDDDHLVLDDEGGATLTNPKTRFIAPALAVLALRGGLDHHEHLDPDGDGHLIQSGHPGALGVGGFVGLGVLGAVIGPLSRPAGLAFSAVGAGRTLYTNILARGREVQFTADTPVQLQLAPGSPAGQ
jgi:hypothetical protein